MGGLVTPVDQEALTPEFSDWLTRTFTRRRPGHARGPRRRHRRRPPVGLRPGDISVPVAIWQGRQDAMVPFAHGEWLAAHVPGAEAHLLDDEGHVSLVHRLDEVLADLRRLAGV